MLIADAPQSTPLSTHEDGSQVWATRQVEDGLFEACAAALALAERLESWHRVGRPRLFDGTEPELQAAMEAMADRLVASGPVVAARALADAMPPDLWLSLEEPSDDVGTPLSPEAA